METTITAPRRKEPRAGRIVAASLVGLVALLVGAAGVAGLWFETGHSEHGYISTGTHRYAANGYAIVSDTLHTDGIPTWLVAKVRVTASSADGKPVFVGVARKADVDRYLTGVPHSTIEDLNFGDFDVTYGASGGSATPAAPAAQTFWVASTEGAGTQTVTWKIHSGHWRVVVMNADGSPRVAADAKLGGSVRHGLVWSLVLLGIGLAIAGLAVALVATGRNRA